MSEQQKKRAVVADPFGNQGQPALYSQHRPRYPPFYAGAIMSYCGPERELYVDMCTGNGQVLAQLHSSFKRTIGIDRSEACVPLAFACEDSHPNPGCGIRFIGFLWREQLRH